MIRFINRFLFQSLLVAFLLASAGARAETITVFAAASLKETLEAAGKEFSAKTGTDVQFSFASSSVLAKQIENGAPAQLFMSADRKWMDYLAERKLIRSDQRFDLLGNNLVVVASQSSSVSQLTFTQDSFAAALAGRRLAIGDVNSVPAGTYAKAAFIKLGLWPALESQLAQADNVRSALAFVARGEAELGVVYKTDALVDKSVKILATFPSDSHEPIIYPVALTTYSQSEQARQFLMFLQSSDAQALFRDAGFRILDPH